MLQRLGEDLYSETWYIANERHELEGLDREAARWPGRGYPEACLLQYALLMLRGLQHVHRQKIVHRDVKVSLPEGPSAAAVCCSTTFACCIYLQMAPLTCSSA